MSVASLAQPRQLGTEADVRPALPVTWPHHEGRAVATGGWDKRVIVWDASTGQPVTEREVAWLVRRLRFSPDGRLLAVAAWTPVNALNEGDSEPALLLYPVALADAKIAQ